MNTINSNEYKILKYLKDNNTKEKITITDIVDATGVTRFDFDKIKDDLLEQKYVSFHKLQLDKATWKVENDGLKRLEKMQTDVEIELLQISVSKNTNATLKINRTIAIFTTVGALCMIGQIIVMKKQLDVSEDQLKIEEEKAELEILQSKMDARQENQKVSIEVKID